MLSSILRIAALSFAHFAVALGIAVLTFGTDLDQLRSRSALSRSAGVLHDILWLPHDTILRSLPSAAILRPWVTPAVLFGSSILWGIALYALWQAARLARRDPSRRSTSGYES